MKAIGVALLLAVSNASTPLPWSEVRDPQFPQAKLEVVWGYDDMYRAALAHDRACDAVTGGVPDNWYSPFTELGWWGHRQLKEPYRTWLENDDRGKRLSR